MAFLASCAANNKLTGSSDNAESTRIILITFSDKLNDDSNHSFVSFAPCSVVVVYNKNMQLIT